MKKLIVAALLSSTALVSVNANAARVEMLDNMMFTINPKARTAGPIFENKDSVKNVYGNQVMTLLLKNADKVASKYLKLNDPEAYYSFLTLAMTVPMHEGLYMHFRQVDNDGDVCNKKKQGVDVGGQTKKLFKKYLQPRFGSAYIPKKCKSVKDELVIKQLVRGANGTDIGMMQVSVRWHYDVFLANKNYESVEETINYGLGFLMKGFEPLYRTASNYNCIYKNGAVNYENLVRGIWGGYYNGGSYKNACRFADAASAYQGHDNGFKRNLDKVLAYPETGIIGMHEDLNLRLSGDVRAAALEVIGNMKNKTNNSIALKRLLNK
jgi:hypothetical protein